MEPGAEEQTAVPEQQEAPPNGGAAEAGPPGEQQQQDQAPAAAAPAATAEAAAPQGGGGGEAGGEQQQDEAAPAAATPEQAAEALPGPPAHSALAGAAGAGAGGAQKRTADDAGLGAAGGGAGGAGGERPSKALRVEGFDPVVRAKLEALVDGGVLTAADVEGSTTETLRKLDQASALELLDALAAAGLAGAVDVAARRAIVVITVAKYARQIKPELNPLVKAKLDALYTTGGGPIRPGDLDDRCIERLREIPVATALSVLEVFGHKKFDYVRNFSALFMTTLKKVMSGEEGPGAGFGGFGGGFPPAPAYGGAAPYQPALPAPPGLGGLVGGAAGALGRVNRGTEQAALGVRVGEFHALNPHAAFVHPAAALRLQQLWDAGNELVSLLDEKAWEGLAQLDAGDAVSLVDETGGKLAAGAIRNVNAFVMSVARRLISEQQMRGAGAVAVGAYGGGGAGYGGGGAGYGGGGAAPGYPPAPAWGGGAAAPGVGGGEGSLHLLSPQVRGVVEDMCRRHHPYLQRHHFDDSAASMLMRIGERDALIVLSELDNTRMESIRSMPAFIMGCVKRHMGRSY